MTQLDGVIPVVGVGGITDGQSAVEKVQAGADLVQIYTGFIYRGPAVVHEAAQAIAAFHQASASSSAQ
jgi:dihydroorotate dehydrogenase